MVLWRAFKNQTVTVFNRTQRLLLVKSYTIDQWAFVYHCVCEHIYIVYAHTLISLDLIQSFIVVDNGAAGFSMGVGDSRRVASVSTGINALLTILVISDAIQENNLESHIHFWKHFNGKTLE